jgi:uncharacterized protein YndB with AHSA1/START domain
MNAAVVTAAIVVRRTITASAEELFDAWLDPEALSIWMRPGTIRSTVATVEPHAGGAYQITMMGQSGPIVHRGVYLLIDRPRRLVFTWASPGTEMHDTLVTVDFVALGPKTEVIVTHEQLPESAKPSHADGWTRGLEHLDEACARGLLNTAHRHATGERS